MLVALTIQDLAIIEDTTLELSEGLNVLTGETGAGKSIIIEALSLVLGDRAEVDLIRRGRERAEVSALFALGPDSPARARLAAHDLAGDEPDTLVVRRVVAPAGRGKVYINGRLATVGALAEITRGLVDVSSQHQHTQLLDPSSHLHILDRFGGLGAERAAWDAAWAALEAARRHARAIADRAAERARREEFVRFQLAELDEIDPKPGEEDELEAERARLAHADRLVAGAGEVVGLLRDGGASVVDRLIAAGRTLDRLRAYDPALAAHHDRLDAARIEVDDIAQDLRAYARGVDLDPRRLDALHERLDALKKLKKKHGMDLSAAIAARDALRAELAGFESLDIDLAEARRALERAEQRAEAAAVTLSAARGKARTDLEARVATELRGLAMGGAAIQFELAARPSLGPEGRESGEILIQTNTGEGFAPLAKVASGGELSRVLLALKRALMHVDPVATCIFDEVDAGTGGAVGDMIGKKLAEIATERQVLCITHLASIAARGKTHLRVHKTTEGDRTATHVARLDARARVDEIARMLGGVDVTANTLAMAKELLQRG
ncbi:MAG: DNA repair protein RecN [Deltaproteobacteria bacterium]|nr:DNA repair protein RecN [Deltaproteobacteria bacterium]